MKPKVTFPGMDHPATSRGDLRSGAGTHRQRRRTLAAGGFTLIELVAAAVIIGILAAVLLALLPSFRLKGRQAASINNMRQIGAAFYCFATDNDMRLPSRVQSSDKWPRLLNDYLKDVKVYAEPGNPSSFVRTGQDPLSNARNNTNYIMNGYNDIGAYADENVTVKVNALQKPSQTILLAIPIEGSTHFYMDFAEGNERQVLNKKAYGTGSNYLFADGSARFITESDYTDDLWLVDKESRTP